MIFVYPVLLILVGLWNPDNGVQFGLISQKLDLHVGSSLNVPAKLVAKVAVPARKLVYHVLRFVFVNVNRMNSCF